MDANPPHLLGLERIHVIFMASTAKNSVLKQVRGLGGSAAPPFCKHPARMMGFGTKDSHAFEAILVQLRTRS